MTSLDPHGKRTMMDENAEQRALGHEVITTLARIEARLHQTTLTQRWVLVSVVQAVVIAGLVGFLLGRCT